MIQSSHGQDLISALAKLVKPEGGFLLRASASSFIEPRLERLAAAQPESASRVASVLLTAAFSALLVGSVFATVSHTACCFLHK